jgi:hypothetical protein
MQDGLHGLVNIGRSVDDIGNALSGCHDPAALFLERDCAGLILADPIETDRIANVALFMLSKVVLVNVRSDCLEAFDTDGIERTVGIAAARKMRPALMDHDAPRFQSWMCDSAHRIDMTGKGRLLSFAHISTFLEVLHYGNRRSRYSAPSHAQAESSSGKSFTTSSGTPHGIIFTISALPVLGWWLR